MTADRFAHLDRFHASEPRRRPTSRPSLDFASLGGSVRETDYGPALVLRRTYPWDRLPAATLLNDHRRPAWDLSRLDPRLPHRISPDQIACVDIETTGLSIGAGTVAFLIGVITAVAEGLELRQYLIRDFNEEPAQQWLLARDLEQWPIVATYNGRRFDIPVLRNRAVMHRTEAPWLDHPHLDLLPPVRSVWRGVWPDCRLATAEFRLLGVVRHADCEGWEVPLRFQQFLNAPAEDVLHEVLEHNAQDLVSLFCLAAVMMRVYDRDWGSFGLSQAEQFGLARAFATRGRTDDAIEVLLEARRMGRLSEDYGRAMQELTRQLKRLRRLDVAREIWQELSSSPDALERHWAHVEEAKYQEHLAGDLSAAEAASEAAGLALETDPRPAAEHLKSRLEHRLARLARRQKHR